MRNTNETLFLHAYGVLGLFLEAFDRSGMKTFYSPRHWHSGTVGQILTNVESMRIKVSGSGHICVKVCGLPY